MSAPSVIGRSLPRLDGGEKVSGLTRFAGDLSLPGMVHCRPVLSPHAHARIVRIDTKAAAAPPGVLGVFGGPDLPLRHPDATDRARCPLALERALFVGHPVAAVVAESEALAEDGVALVTVEYAAWPAVIDPEEAMRPEAPRVGEPGEGRSGEEALAMALKRPVAVVLSRAEEFLSTTPAPQSVIEVTTGARRDGSLTALRARVIFDAGAFAGAPAGIACLMLGGYYRVPHLDIRGHEVLTHTPGQGAYRAPGAVQATFAMESQMDAAAPAAIANAVADATGHRFTELPISSQALCRAVSAP